MEDVRLWLWYTIAMGSQKALARTLYNKVGSVKTLFDYTKSDYEELGVKTEKRLNALCDKSFKQADDTLWFAEKYGVKIITIDSEEYPERLKQIYDPPLLIYVRGVHFNPKGEMCIAMVGTKDGDKYGYDMARSLAKDLAHAGVNVVSSMSRGLDGFIQSTVIDSGGFTTAVVPNGVNKSYVPENVELMKRIMNHGAVISEYGFYEYPYNSNFVARNRIISGLCMGTVVVQAPKKSGTLIISNFALDQSRDVFAVPGPADNMHCEGTNNLIKTSAKMVTTAKDILEEYMMLYPQYIKTEHFENSDIEFDIPKETTGSFDTGAERVVLNCLKDCRLRKDEIIVKSGLDASIINGAITMLEITDKIEQDEFGFFKIKG